MRKLLIAVVIALACALLPGVAQAADSPAGQLMSEYPAPRTPHVLDAEVYSIAQLGDTMVLGGGFTIARNDDSTTQLSRKGLLAFSVSTGHISTTFVPQPNGTIRKVLPAPDGTSVFVAGSFTTIGGVARQNLARVRISDGTVLPTFNANGITGMVRDLALVDGRLWIAGPFTHVGGHAQPALATVNPDTGAWLPYMGLAIAGTNNGGATQVMKMDVTPDGNKLVAIGNFHTLAGVVNHQLFVLDISGASAAPGAFHTSFYTSVCSSSFESYMRDVSISPDGSYFVVATTGAYHGSTSACDTTARFEVGATGADVRPSWVDYTGGDTTYSVEVTDSAVYTGGHMRWQNNPFAGDRAGQGAVSREGIAALDPVNGLPLSWNPGRTKGVGVFDFLFTPQGLWVASDTDRIGHYTYKGRIALMPATGVRFPAVRTPGLPNAVFSGGGVGAAVLGGVPAAGIVRRSYSDGSTGAQQSVPSGGIAWNDVRGAFMLNGQLYLAQSDGTFTRRTFDGTNYGAPQPVNTSDLIVPLTDWRSDIGTTTGMFYDSGRIYFTRSGSSTLYYRYFSPQSDVVGAQRFTASGNVAGIDFSAVRGMFTTGSALYWATLDGNLHRIGWAQGAQSGTPVAGTAAVTSGPGVDGASWGAHAIFLYQDANANGIGVPPTAAFTSSCVSVTCHFDGTGSTSGGGSLSYAWQFGDGQTGTGATPDHDYAGSGNYPVTLTVTSASGTATVTHTVAVVRVNQSPTAAFIASCTGLACTFDGHGSSDPEGPIASYTWDFGDGANAVGVTTNHQYAAAGTKDVTLVVRDGDGATDSLTKSIAVATAGVQFVDSTGRNASTTQQRVTIPSSVRAGDTMVLYLTVNSTAATATPPAGWTQLDSLTGSNVFGRSWTRTAGAADAGSTVTVPLSTTVKSDLTLVAYRGVGGVGTTVIDHAAGLDQTSGTAHQAPSVTPNGSGQWVSTYWAAKASEPVTWTVPPDLTARQALAGTGSGLISSLTTDSGGAVPAGPWTGRTATTSVSVTRVVMFSTVIGPDQ